MSRWFRIEIDAYYDEKQGVPDDLDAQLRESIERCTLENGLLDGDGSKDSEMADLEFWKCDVTDCGSG